MTWPAWRPIPPARQATSRPLASALADDEGQRGASGCRSPAQVFEVVGHRLVRHDRVAPRVTVDEFGQQLGAQAVGLAHDRIDLQAVAHQALAAPGTGSNGGRRTVKHGPSTSCQCASWPNALSALAASWVAPSG